MRNDLAMATALTSPGMSGGFPSVYINHRSARRSARHPQNQCTCEPARARARSIWMSGFCRCDQVAGELRRGTMSVPYYQRPPQQHNRAVRKEGACTCSTWRWKKKKLINDDELHGDVAPHRGGGGELALCGPGEQSHWGQSLVYVARKRRKRRKGEEGASSCCRCLDVQESAPHGELLPVFLALFFFFFWPFCLLIRVF